MDQTRKILSNGMKGYVAKVKRRRLIRRRIYRTAKESSLDRIKKKLIGKTSWYRRSKAKEGEEQTMCIRKGAGGASKTITRSRKLKTRAVLFMNKPLGGSWPG